MANAKVQDDIVMVFVGKQTLTFKAGNKLFCEGSYCQRQK